MLKAVIFDMDGVLVDSEPIHFRANQMTLKEMFGIELDYEYYKHFIGSTIKAMWQEMHSHFHITGCTWEDLMKRNDEILEQIIETEGYPEVPGAAALVRQLHDEGYLLAVASSSKREKIVRNMESLGILDCFRVLVSGMELANPKPAPDIFLKTVQELGVQPEECIVIEDSANGAQASKAAKIPCLGFLNPNSGEQDLSAADYLFEDFHTVDERFLRMVHDHHLKEP
jgi:HAD superfamily hydrolase (TIGR01509 family)